jgi:transglutaminase-like putative cysteine protease
MNLLKPGLFLMAVMLWLWTSGQGPVAESIADSLRKDAGMVKRSDITEIDIESPRKAKIHRKYVYTILNSTGDQYANISTFYDKFNDLNDVTAILYDADGKVIKKIRKNDMEDWSVAGSGILMTDSRIRFYHFSWRSYPYSVSFEEEKQLNGLFNLPDWRPQPSHDVAVEGSSLVVRVPPGYPLRYKQYHYPGQPGTTDEKGGTTYTWEMRDRPAANSEPFAPAWFRTETSIRLAPGDFEEAGYKGRLYSWTDLGKFIGDLYRGRDQLPAEARAKVHQLTDGLKDDREKIAVLYRYLQQNTHYVGIELGIGGWQPFDATYVYNKRYGDCKALANYMVALLKEAGIRAWNVLIRAGQAAPAIDTGFACNQFNHAIAVAIAGSDSIWLECTSQLLPPGYLGSFTADRDALLLDDGGGRIVHTPVYGWKENRFDRTVQGTISDNGALEASMQTGYGGLEQDALQVQIDRLPGSELTRQRQQNIGINNCTITALNYHATPGPVPSIEETMRLSADHFTTISGNRLFLPLDALIKQSEGLHEGAQPRQNELELPTSYEETDSILLQLPHGFVPEGALPSASYTADFGSYHIQSVLRGDNLVITCRFRQYKGIYPAGDWSKIVYFFNLINQEDDRQLVFIKQ